MAEINFWKDITFDKIKVYKSSQLIRNTVPVQNYNGQIFYPVYRCRLQDLNVDELYDISGSVEVTNGNNYLVEVVTKVVINDNYDDSPHNTSAYAIGAGGGCNVSNDRHHEIMLRNIHWIPPQYHGNKNVTLMVRARSSNYSPGDVVSLNQATCELTILRFT